MLLPLNHLPSPSTRPLGKGLIALGVQFCLDWFVNQSLLPPGPGLRDPFLWPGFCMGPGDSNAGPSACIRDIFEKSTFIGWYMNKSYTGTEDSSSADQDSVVQANMLLV